MIAYNIISGTHDSGTGDGNGVEVDQWTHGNAVYGNVAYRNDGAGIVVYRLAEQRDLQQSRSGRARPR